MGQAIGQSLPFAIGVALSPIPIIAVVLLLTTPRAGTNGPAFVAGWLLGLGVVGAIVLLLAGPADAGTAGAPATWVGWLKLALGVLLLLLAVREFRARPREGEEPAMPKSMGALGKLKPGAALGLAAGLAGANPKNLLLAVGGAVAIAQTGISGSQQVSAYVLFALIATIGVGIPVGIYVVMRDRSQALLARLNDWMAHNNATIMSVLCLIIGVKLIGDAISALVR
jgi:hypothetical protein